MLLVLRTDHLARSLCFLPPARLFCIEIGEAGLVDDLAEVLHGRRRASRLTNAPKFLFCP
jgi:hypothetical protein